MSTRDIPEDPRIQPKYRRRGLRKIKTVGELIAHLRELPFDMLMDTGFSDSLDVYVTRRHAGDGQSFRCVVGEYDSGED